MDLNLNQKQSLTVFKALANETRLKIIQVLSEGQKNISQIAEVLEISKPIVTRHIQQLEEAQLIETKHIPAKSGKQKICHLKIEQLNISFPKKLYPEYKVRTIDIPIGHYTDYHVQPTCGLASQEKFIGEIDSPRFFLDRERVDAELLWFTQGFVEYKVPNIIQKEDTVEMIEISMEVASEFPISNNNWPSDISFYLNNQKLGVWTSPGNYSDVPGLNNPDWWPRKNSQYGLLKHLRIFNSETLIDSETLSFVNLDDIDLTQPLFTLRLAVEETASNIGGLTLFGEHFGNHPQNIILKIFYS